MCVRDAREKVVMRLDLDALRSDVRHLGVARTLLRSTYYRLNALLGVRLYEFITLEVEDLNAVLLAREVPYECRMLEPDEARRFAAEPESGMSVAFADKALATGGLCFGVLDGDTLASMGWYAKVPTTVLRTTWVTFEPAYWYMYQGYTRAAYRGQNLHGIGLVRACKELCARGAAGIVTLAEAVNFASLDSAHRAGYRSRGRALVVPIGDRRFVLQTRTPERYGLRLTTRTP